MKHLNQMKKLKLLNLKLLINEEGRINRSQLIDELHKLGVERRDISEWNSEKGKL